MALTVKLQAFEGPLDLLLHLIEKNKVDIYDIPIVDITDQYLKYIRQMETEDMNIMSEFLLMAATLLDIKCRMLLPAEINEDGEEADPRAELVQKLLEYKMYKYMSLELKDRQTDARKNLFKIMTLPQEVKEYKTPIDYEQLIGESTLQQLHELFKTMLKRQADKIDPIRSTFSQVEKDEVDMEAKMAYVEGFIHRRRKLTFIDLLERQSSKMEIIVTFLIILELMKMGKINIHQESTYGDIYIVSNEVRAAG